MRKPLPPENAKVAIPLRGFLFATMSQIEFVLRFSEGCNPLTGLFVCNPIALQCPQVQLKSMLQSPYGAFCLQQHTPLIAVL